MKVRTMAAAISGQALAAVTVLLLACTAGAQNGVTIQVNAAESQGPWKPIWRYFGYDEPNYTYMQGGRQLLQELASLSERPVYVRTHNLLTTGDGQPALKWGSTNAYREDGSGRPIYDWTILDRIFDTYREAGLKPYVEIGFMPRALSIHPEPYQHHWPKGPLATGWAYPPKDYGKWSELVYQWVRHCVERYGRREVESWNWEVWNEPDIFYWQGTPEEYFKLYDYTAQAVKRALPAARIGGPATTGPSGKSGAEFLRSFLEHCAAGKNYAGGGQGSPLDFISYHAKGRVSVVGQQFRMDISRQTEDVERGLEIISSFAQFRALPIVVSESDPEGCAACSARSHPENAYRNGAIYAAYTAAMLKSIVDLSAEYGNRVQGMLTWAFEYEDQPYFAGFRTLATNGVDKPVLNLFRMAGLMVGQRVKVSVTGNTEPRPEESISSGTNALATRRGSEVSVLAWNYHNEVTPADEETVNLRITGLPETMTRALLTQYRIDGTHSNAYTAWRQMDSPQAPTPEQYSALRAAGQLHLLDSPQWIDIKDGKAELSLTLPRESVALLRLQW